MHLIKKFNQEYGRNVESISPAALERLASYSWPGNVRELENILGRAMIHMSFHGRRIEVEHLPLLEDTPFPSQEKQEEVEETVLLRDVVAQAEEKMIRRVYYACKGNKTETARRLGISVRNLYYKLEPYQIEWDFHRDKG